MKFVYTKGQYAEFRGYVFAFGNPVTITDKATEEALLKHHDFRRIEDGEKRQNADERQDAPQRQKRLLVTNPIAQPENACPKCGKVIRQGRYLHVKFCRGDEV